MTSRIITAIVCAALLIFLVVQAQCQVAQPAQLAQLSPGRAGMMGEGVRERVGMGAGMGAEAGSNASAGRWLILLPIARLSWGQPRR